MKGQALGVFRFKHFVITILHLGINCSMREFHTFPLLDLKRGGQGIECLVFLKLGELKQTALFECC